MSVVGAEAEEGASITRQIVERVAAAEGVSPTDLESPLYSVVDPDALETLCRQHPGGTAGSDFEVRFTYAGYRVRVTGRDDVEVSPRTDGAEA